MKLKLKRIQSGLTLVMLLIGAAFLSNACSRNKPAPERFAFAIGLKPEKIAEYKKLHAETWPEILELIEKSNIRNYSIHLGETEKDKYYLFAYFEYEGDNLEEDMKKMADQEVMQQWWELTDACQIPCPTRKEGEFWMELEEVFYTD